MAPGRHANPLRLPRAVGWAGLAILAAFLFSACNDDDGPAPDSATFLIARGGIGQVALSWTAPAAGAAPIEYAIIRNPTSGTAEYPADEVGRVTADLTAFSDTEVSNGTRYYYQVVAVNRGGSSVASNEVNADPRDYSSEIGKFIASDTQSGDGYGLAVDMGDGIAVVGAPLEDGGTGDPALDRGAAYIYERDAEGAWSETTGLLASNGELSGLFGFSVAVSGTIMIVAAPREDGSDNLTADAGAAYVFERQSDGSWAETAVLRASDAQAGDQFGSSVGLSGNFAVVGASFEDGGSGDPTLNVGAVYVFERQDAGTWNEVANLHPSPDQAGDDFGASVDIDGDYLVVGAPLEDGGTGDPASAQGAAYLFERGSDGGWSQTALLRDASGEAGDFFGISVAVSGDYAIVGASGDAGDTGNLPGGGGAWVYQRQSDGAWIEFQTLRASNRKAGDGFGGAVSLDGNLAVIGAQTEDGGVEDSKPSAGAAYVFELSTVWEERAILHASDGQNSDNFGTSVAIWENDVLIGADLEDGGTGDTLTDAGVAYLY